MRTPIGKSVRFEVFKRDGFTCQYCGATPPDAVLEVDHIDPVASGGGNEEGNLVTACFDCNRGKAARSLSVVPLSLTERAKRVAEAEEQLAGYREIMRAAEARKEADAWYIVGALFGEHETTRERFASIERFLERLTREEVFEAAIIARRAKPSAKRQRFLYFCGVCWRKIGEASDGQD